MGRNQRRRLQKICHFLGHRWLNWPVLKGVEPSIPHFFFGHRWRNSRFRAIYFEFRVYITYKYQNPPRTIIQGRMASNSASATSGATLKVHLETLCMSSFCLSFNADVAVSFGDHSKLALQMTALTFQLQNFQPHFFGDSA